jgi:hypothetical protein
MEYYEEGMSQEECEFHGQVLDKRRAETQAEHDAGGDNEKCDICNSYADRNGHCPVCDY